MAMGVQVTFDCADPAALSRFWAEALHYVLPDPPAGFASWEDWLRDAGVPEDQWNSASAVVDPEGKGPRLYFQQVPERKTVKNRLHLDLSASGGPQVPIEERKGQIEPEIERMIALGATLIERQEMRGEYWMVMADPEGNEFCLH